jgi:hypothetical protein
MDIKAIARPENPLQPILSSTLGSPYLHMEDSSYTKRQGVLSKRDHCSFLLQDA